MSTKLLGAITALAGTASAFWRMPCGGRLLLERADPVVFPGAVSPHVHTISGGNGFGFKMDYDQANASTCSSCAIKKDLSNYWTPKLYFMAEDGTFEDVPQAGEGDGQTGGMTVYYQQRGGPNNDKLKAFPDEFRMVAGDPFQRNQTDAEAAPGNAVSFVCLDYSGTSDETKSIPNKNCPDGLRAQVYFPSCWDGKNGDSPDHKSHMHYPIGKYDSGSCPDSHPEHLVSIFFEVIYSIDQFADRWHGDGHPFVFAQGDRTGYGFHGDFINGWDHDTLQKAVDTCTNDSGTLEDCPVFANDLFTAADQQACRLPPSVDETLTGTLKALAGCNPPTSGPEYAQAPRDCEKAEIGTQETYFTDLTSSESWAYAGCAQDDYFERTLTGPTTSSDNMTVKTCVDFCASKGHVLAGLEYARECYCGDKYSSEERAPKKGVMGACQEPCSGDSGEICGAAGALSMYRKCDKGEECENVAFGAGAAEKRRKKRHLGAHRHGRAHLDG
ncbi:hypothetical protein Q7P37_004342 [Cladosporium fusiforme]